MSKLAALTYQAGCAMRTYDNVPVLNWQEKKAPLKAKAQILHQEPVIIQMPDNFNTRLDDSEIDCVDRGKDGMLYNCQGGDLLNKLAVINALPDLNIIAEACVESSSQVDIDPKRKRLIVHD